MDTNKEAVEENPPPKSSGSIIQISSIYIELPIAASMEKNEKDRKYKKNQKNGKNGKNEKNKKNENNENGECSNHGGFTIRGFSFDNRRSGQTVASLFPSIAETSNASECLPPMEIPEFRSSLCSQCVATIIESGLQEGPTVGTTESIQSNGANVHLTSNSVEGSTSLPIPPEIATTKALDIACNGDKNKAIKRTQDAVEKISNEDKNAKTVEVIAGGHSDVPFERMNTEFGDVSGQSKMMNTDSGDVGARSELPKPASRDKLIIPPEKDKSVSTKLTADGIPPKTDETETDRGRENDNSNGVPRRKIRKVRLLTDLLGEKGNVRVKTTERNQGTSSALLESSGSGNVALEGQVGPNKDAANRVQSPRRKSKVTQEDQETNDPSNAATNVSRAAPKKDTGKAIMVVEVPNSDVEVAPSVGEGLFIGTKSERLRRRNDIFPILKKKNKQTEVLDFAGSLPSLVRSLPAPSATGSWGTYPSAEHTDCDHNGFLSGAVKYQPSYNSSARVGLDLSLNSFSKRNHYEGSSSKDILEKDDVLFGESIKRPATELERSHGEPPSWDLNERAAPIPYNLEKENFPVTEEVDFLRLGFKENSSVVQGNPNEIDQRANDIPMEIVEMLAKKQYERRNSNIGEDPLLHRANDSTRRFRDGDTMGTMKHLTKGYSGLHSFPPLDGQSVAAMSSENAATHKGNSVNFSQMSRNHLKLVQAEANPKSIFTAFPQNQQKLSSGMQISPATSVRTGLQYSAAVEPLLSLRSAKLPFGFGLQQKNSAQQHKGITISDIKADELRKTEDARLTFTKPGDPVVVSKPKGSSVTYANESIPALQLLSLMDGRSSGTDFNLGTPKILDKPFSPCSFHPRFSRDERQDFLNGSLFSRQSHPKEASSLRPTFSNSYLSSRLQSSTLSSNITPEKGMSRDKSQKAGSSSGAGPSSSHDKGKQKPSLNGSSLVVYPRKTSGSADSRRLILEPISFPGGVRPLRSISADGVCRTNRNPAEFSVAEAGNMYTICGKDLKPRKRKYSRKNPPSAEVDGADKQKNKKAKVGDEHPRDRSS